VGEWSAAETLAHAIGWQTEALAALTAIRDGAPLPEQGHEDAFNVASSRLSFRSEYVRHS